MNLLPFNNPMSDNVEIIIKGLAKEVSVKEFVVH